MNAAALSALPLVLALGFALASCAVILLSGERAHRLVFKRVIAPAERRLLRSAGLACLAGAWIGAGWAAASEPLVGLFRQMPPPLILLGEVHDNAQQHALRLQAFELLLKGGARPALLMEQFDRERQTDIDSARRMPGADADSLIAAGALDASRWHGSFYKPFVALALQHDLPIVAANVSRPDARRVMAEGLQALAFDDRVPPDIAATQAEIIVAAHCGAVDAALGLRMGAAQIARDQFMARMVERHAARGVVLLAGNSHVRRDIGVPRWLSQDLAPRVKAIGLLEDGDDDHAAYDVAVTTPRQTRDEPCATLRRRPPQRAARDADIRQVPQSLVIAQRRT